MLIFNQQKIVAYTLRILAFSPFAFSHSPATAQHETNGWAVGGGEIKGEALNPWFIQNTKTINFCIESASEFDAGEYGETYQLKWLIEQAFAYWKKEFDAFDQRFLDIKLGTQTLVLQAKCDDSTDLRFQFGFLTNDQIIALTRKGIDPRKNVALTVRTDYETKKMKGKGFIYLAPRQGELKPEGKYNLPWNTSVNDIYRTLVHEMGHIYGVAHSADLVDVMFEGYGELLLQTDPEHAKSEGIKPIFSKFGNTDPLDLPIGITLCFMTEETRKFYGLSEFANGISWRSENKDAILIEEANCNENGNTEKKPAGKIKLNKTDPAISVEMSPIRAWLPADQNVIPRKEGDSSLRYGIFPLIRTYSAEYITESKEISRSLLLQFQPFKLPTLYSSVNGRAVYGPNLFLTELPRMVQ